MSQFSWQSRRTGGGSATGQGGGSGAGAEVQDRASQRKGQGAEAVTDLKFTLHQRLIEELDPNKLQGLDPERAREAVEAAARTLIAQEMPGIVGAVRDELVATVADEVLGLGPIEPLIKAGAEVTSMVVGPASLATLIAAVMSRGVLPVSQASSCRLGVAMSASGSSLSRIAAAVASGT